MGIYTEYRQKDAENTFGVRIHNMAHNMNKLIVNRYKQMMKFVWENPQGLSPQEVFDQLGDKSVEWVDSMDLLEDFIFKTAPHELYAHPNRKEVTKVINGRVIVND